MAKEKTETKETKKGSNKTLVIVLVVIAVLVGLSLIGRFIYKKVAERVASNYLSTLTGGKVSVTGGGDKVSFKGEDGEVTFDSGGKLPEGFPSDFPVYPGAKVTGSFSASGDNNSKGSSVVWETSDDVAKVGGYFKTELPKAGWTISTDYSTAETITLTFEKGAYSGFLGVTKGSDGKTAISVTIGVK